MIDEARLAEVDETVATILDPEMTIGVNTATAMLWRTVAPTWRDLRNEMPFTPAQVNQLCHDLVASRAIIRKMADATITRDEFDAVGPWLNSLGERVPKQTVYAHALKAYIEAPGMENLTL